MTVAFPLKVILSAVDKFAAPLSRMQARIDRTVGPLRNLHNRVSSLYAASGIEKLAKGFAGVGRGISDVAREAFALGTKIVGMAAVAGGALFAIVNGFAHAGDAAVRVADKLGLPVVTFQELAYAAKQNAVETATLETGLAQLQARLGRISQGNAGARVAFDRLGIAVFDFAGRLRTVDALLPEIADRILELDDPTKAANLAMQLFGKSGADLLPLLRQGARGIAEAREEAQRLGLVLDDAAARRGKEFGDAVTRLMGALEGLRNVIGAALAPALQDLIDKFVAFVVENRPMIEAFARDFAKELPGRLAQLRDFFVELHAKMAPLIAVGSAIVDTFGGVNVVLGILAVVLGAKLVIALASLIPAVYALGTALLTTPVGWILGGLALLVAAVVLLVKYWDPIAAFFIDLWDTVTGAFAAGFSWVWEHIPWVLGPVALIIRYWDEIAGFFETLWGAVRVLFTEAWEFVKKWGLYFLGPVGLIIKHWGRIKAFFVDLWEGVRDIFARVYSWIVEKLVALVDMLPAWVKTRLGFEVNLAPTQAPPERAPRGGGGRGDGGGGRPGPGAAEVTVRFENAPKGARVQSDRNDGVDLDVSMGYAMQGP